MVTSGVVVQVLSNLVRVRTLVARHISRQDEARTNEFLYAASRGDTDRVLQVGWLSDSIGRCALSGVRCSPERL